jgi:hypothetical protein
MEIVTQILRSRHKIIMRFPQPGTSPVLVHFGKGELSDILGFGFSYVEQSDHFVSSVLVSPGVAKKLVNEIDSFYFTVDTPYIGMLWTAKIIITDKIGDSNFVFSNEDQSVVLDLYTNNMEE